ncbi:hypothetical protein DEU56DRAFT_929068 [Suillus clintonianus]|uniref:uncharacterized protein n=1 Tax=Suillus clintonianus TaxID=1904413 RepID=UPI001B864262|nr:uncharacterized protein DEU56DRAFT_929068 [Suillus clintonianus]KAG2119333.1 hypothetical protein DEU56DRAFT_929068 [Suillus clintonianus]
MMCIKNDTTDLRSLLQPYFHQISSLDITFDKAAAPALLLNDLPTPQKLRVDIRYHGIADAKEDTLTSILPPISRLSILRSLELETLSRYDSKCLSRLNPAWAHLTNVNLILCKPREVMGLLQLSPNLCSLNIDMLLSDGLSLEPYTHTSIQYISITFIHVTLSHSARHPLEHLFNALTLPNFVCLELGNYLSHYEYVSPEWLIDLVEQQWPEVLPDRSAKCYEDTATRRAFNLISDLAGIHNLGRKNCVNPQGGSVSPEWITVFEGDYDDELDDDELAAIQLDTVLVLTVCSNQGDEFEERPIHEKMDYMTKLVGCAPRWWVSCGLGA